MLMRAFLGLNTAKGGRRSPGLVQDSIRRAIGGTMDALRQSSFLVVIVLVAVAAAGFIMWLLEQQGWLR
jgi:hypothetical protein